MVTLSGTRLGPYEVRERLGAGGMGEVYRAHDSRLGRDVALKVILTEGEPSAERLKRFEDEARAVARLTHPNVLAVFDVGAHDGRPYLVFELLEGETLRQRLRGGALPLRSAVESAVQVCHGLQAAHGRGILHRDLKPENLFLTSDGFVKILDFGLAKLTRGDGAEAGPGRTQTVAGVVMGTPGYLSPEQARGGEADARSDLFALGAILYEALSGRRAFSGATAAETISAILHEDPPPVRTASGPLPGPVERVVRRCLAKEPGDRFHSAHDLAFALEAVLDRPAAVSLAGDDGGTTSPYPGLGSFTEADADRFFGREGEIEALWQRIRARRLLAVIGPSGAGKTSFVRAGVVASRPTGWAAVVTTPGNSPLLMLGQALASELQGDVEALRRLVRFEDPGEAFETLVRWRKAHGEALLVVDQFEELFTLCPPEAQARFAALLGRLAGEAGVHVLLSMRDDFLMRCHEHEALAPVFAELTPLGPLGGDALRRALEEPAKAEGFRFEPGLVGKMTAAVEGERGALPLLAFAVSRLWEKRERERKLLTQEAYAEIGGVVGALARHAEATLERIGAERQGMVREVFRNLVTAQGTRAACDRDELLSVFPDRKAAEEVLAQLVAARLLTSYEVSHSEGAPGGAPSESAVAPPGAGGATHRIEIVHESLLRSWLRLVRWQVQDAEGSLLRDQLKQAAHLWDEKGRPADLLWSGTSFREHALWRERYTGQLTALEEQYAKTMVERARRRRRVITVGIAAAFLVLLSVAGAIAVSRQQAVAARSRAESSRLLALSQLEIDRYPTAALAYATKGLEIDDTPEGRLQALRILWKAPPARILPMPDGTRSLNLTFSRDGRWLAATGFEPVVALFSEDGRLAQRLTREGAKAQPRVPFLDFGGDAVFWWTWGGPEVLAWTLEGRSFPAFGRSQWWVIGSEDGAFTFAPPPGGASGALLQKWSVSGGLVRLQSRLLVADEEFPDRAFVQLRRNAGPSLYVRPFPREGREAPPVLVGRHEADISFTDASPHGERVLSIDRSSEWRLWSAADHRLLARRKPPAPHAYSAALFDQTGSRIGWSSAEGPATYVWDLGDPPGADLLKLPWGEQTGDGGRVAFHPGGRWMAAAAGYRTVFLWALASPHARVLQGHTQGPIVSLLFTPDSRHLVSCARDGLRVWPLGLGEGVQQRVELPSEYFCYGADVDARGEALALAAVPSGLFVVPLATRKPRCVLPLEPGPFLVGAAFDVTGRWLATRQVRMEDYADGGLHVVDLTSAAIRTLSSRSRRPGSLPPTSSFGFTWDGHLLTAGEDGIFRWDAEGRKPTAIFETPGLDAHIRTTPDGRWLVASVGKTQADGAAPMQHSQLLVFDLTKGTHWPVASHGPDVAVATLDASGTRLVTGGVTGTVRVGFSSGGTPHLLVGHPSGINAVAVSPDGRWVASSSGTEIRLWPMPDLSKPPLHTLPHEELIGKLRSLTNLRVVEDRASPGGYKLEIGPFPGWKDVPTW